MPAYDYVGVNLCAFSYEASRELGFGDLLCRYPNAPLRLIKSRYYLIVLWMWTQLIVL